MIATTILIILLSFILFATIYSIWHSYDQMANRKKNHIKPDHFYDGFYTNVCECQKCGKIGMQHYSLPYQLPCKYCGGQVFMKVNARIWETKDGLWQWVENDNNARGLNE